MKRLVRPSFVLAVAVLVTGVGFVFSPVTAAADHSNITIDNQAQLFLFVPGSNGVGVQVHYVCSGGSGRLTVSATQTPQQSGTGVGAHGSLSSAVLCDGHPHFVSETILGTATWNLGSATATATLTAPSGTATDTGSINIVQ
jgi:hypothetical protein